MQPFRSILFAVLLCLAVGFVGSQLQAGSLETWYPLLQKSSLTPPNWAFPLAWTLLYIAMGVSAGLIANTSHPRRKELLTLFAVQLTVNFFWSILFFTFRSPLMGFLTICLLEALIIVYAVRAYPVRRMSSWLFWPYILWVGFAAYLNLYILLHN